MKITKWIIGLLLIGILTYVSITALLEPKIENKKSEIPTEVKIIQRFDETGLLKSDAEMVNGIRHGKAHNYYNNGKVHSVINYSNNKKEGLSIWFYEDGKPYRETPFINDKKDGVQKKYYKTGQLMAEMPFYKDKLQPGTIEYDTKGKLIDKELNLEFKTLNKPSGNIAALIEITGKDLKEVLNYEAFFYENQNKVNLIGERENKAIRFRVPSVKGQNINVEVLVWLTTETKMKNKKITEKKIAVEL